MTRQARIVATARRWIGTPYRHQAACFQAGCDCLGLLRGVWQEVLGPLPEQIPSYSRDWSEPQGEERLWLAAKRHLVPKQIGAEAAGDILLFRMRSGAMAKHLGIVSQIGTEGRFIHAYSGHGVVESAFALPWRRRVIARFSFPEGEG